MIEKFINYIKKKDENYIIFDIGSRDCKQSIEFYKTFPNAKIYAFECNPNTLDLCEKNIQLEKNTVEFVCKNFYNLLSSLRSRLVFSKKIKPLSIKLIKTINKILITNDK